MTGIRVFRPEDCEGVRSVLWKTWIDSYSSFVPEKDLRSYYDEHYSPEALLRLMATTGTEGMVAESENSIVGVMIGKYDHKRSAYSVASLYILPKEQGSGLGSRLLRLAEERARSHALNELYLGVMVQNTRSVEWYLRKGFTIQKEEPFAMGETEVPHYIMHLDISTS